MDSLLFLDLQCCVLCNVMKALQVNGTNAAYNLALAVIRSPISNENFPNYFLKLKDCVHPTNVFAHLSKSESLVIFVALDQFGRLC